MTDIEFLTLVQQQTDTKAVVVDEYYKSAFMDWAILDHNAPKHIISRKFDELIDEFIRIEMPTPYESMVHYPFVKRLLDELCFTCKEIGLFDDTFQKPLIGTANLTKINAYAKSDYNTIIIDRNLIYFISNIARVVDLLRKYGQSIGLDVSTHPDDRAGLAHYTIQQMKAGGYALGMAEAIRGIMIMLWDITHKQVIELSKDPMITDIDTLRRVVSLIDFKGNYNFY